MLAIPCFRSEIYSRSAENWVKQIKFDEDGSVTLIGLIQPFSLAIFGKRASKAGFITSNG